MEDVGRKSALPKAGDGLVRVTVNSLLAQHKGAEFLSLRPHRVRAFNNGGYLSPFKGRGMEFDEARPYMPGDDLRTIDWRVTARSGKAHTKLFREERERAVLLWIDLRASMFFATRGAFKSVRAAQAAALLGWNTLHRGDRLGALIFDETTHTELRPARGNSSFMHLVRRLAEHPAWDSTERRTSSEIANTTLAQAVTRLRRVAQPGSLVVLFSDFDGLNSHNAAQISHLARHNDLILVHSHDPFEIDLPPSGSYRVSDGIQFRNFSAGDDTLRERYHRRYAERNDILRNISRGHRMVLLPLSTGDEPLETLRRELGGQR